VRRAGILAVAAEARSLGSALRSERAPSVGPVVVTGVLAEQLAKELGAGADPGAVTVGGEPLPSTLDVLVHVIAGDPTSADVELVREATIRGADTVVVELWPQEEWTRPFVLSPFVVECRAGQGFPVREIADRIVEASGNGTALASRVPVLADAVRDGLVRQSVIRSALIGLAGSRLGVSRPLLTLEQMRLGSRLRMVSGGGAEPDQRPLLAAQAAVVVGSGFAFRRIARAVRTVLPAPVAYTAVAAGGTWVLAKALETIQARLPSS
jgi:hypothetical protein